MADDNRPYTKEEESGSNTNAHESAVALVGQDNIILPEDTDYALIENGILRITPDIEMEIAAVERGETVSLDEFKTMFAQWLA